MTITEILQLYTPLAGLLVVVFWLGVLSERVGQLRSRLTKAEADITILQGEDGHGSVRLVRLEVQMENIAAQVESMVRAMEGVQRQFANLMQRPTPREFEIS